MLALGAARALGNDRVSSIVAYEPVAWGAAYDDPGGDVRADLARFGDSFFSVEHGGTAEWYRRFIDYWNKPGAWDALPSAQRDAFLARDLAHRRAPRMRGPREGDAERHAPDRRGSWSHGAAHPRRGRERGHRGARSLFAMNGSSAPCRRNGGSRRAPRKPATKNARPERPLHSKASADEATKRTRVTVWSDLDAEEQASLAEIGVDSVVPRGDIAALAKAIK
jgi:hypothetical protein